MADKVQNLDMSVDLTQPMLWQYGNAPELSSLVNAKNSWYQTNQVAFWNNWIANVFDIRTCGQFGLVVWSIILNIPLHISVMPSAMGPAFGFSVLNKNFGNGNFQTIAQSIVSLTIDQQRTLLLLRYYQLTGKYSIPAINRMLKSLLGNYGQIYALDPLDMSRIIYVVNFTPSAALYFILANCNVLPRPAGVGLSLIIPGFKTFGFGAFNQNFNNGNFIDPTIEVF